MKKTFSYSLYFVFVLVVFTIYFTINIIVNLLGCLILAFAPKTRFNWNWMMGRSVAKFFLFLVGCKIEFSGFENIPFENGTEMGKFCLMSNHTSILDIAGIIGYGKIRAGFIAKKSLSKIPFFNYYMWLAHCIFIDRKSIHSNIQAIKKGCENINKGIPMLIFPEGTRSKTSEVLDFKHGSMKLALRTGCIIVPVAIVGVRKYLEGRTTIKVPKTKACISYLEPIDTYKLSDEEKEKLADIIHDRIQAEISKNS